MKLYKTYFTILYFFTSGITVLYAQSDVVAAGGRATGTGGNVSYSIGQVNYINSKNSNGKITQGVQQPYEIFVEEGETQKGIQLVVSAYPNPANGFVTLKIEAGPLENLEYAVYDEQGKEMTRQIIAARETNISLLKKSYAIYIIRVFNNNHKVKSFKIINNKQ